MSLDGFSMYPLFGELHRQLSGGRVDRVFQPNKHTVILLIRQAGKSHALHLSILAQNPSAILSSRSFDNPATPPVFCMVLRKQLEGGRIAEIRQFGLDRMAAIDIDVLGVGGVIHTKTLIAELMGKYSNLILVEDGIVIDAIKKVGTAVSRVRQILPNKPYLPPPHQDKINVLTSSIKDFIERLSAYHTMPLAKGIVQTALGMGPVSARELTWRAGLPPDFPISDLTPLDFASLSEALRSITDELRAGDKATVVLDPTGRVLAMSAYPLEHLSGNEQRIFPTPSEAVDFAAQTTGSYTIPEKEIYRRTVANELAKATKKLQALGEDLTQAQNAEEFKIKADLLMTYQYQITQEHMDSVQVPDLYGNENDEITIELDPRLNIMQNMQVYYNKYNKLKRALESLDRQIIQTKDDILYLASIENSLESSENLTEINEIKEELIASGYLPVDKKRKPKEKPSRPLKFRAPEGLTILVGKNNCQNDALTFKIAQFSDLWFHTKDIPGSHVVLRTEGIDPPEDAISMAAQLAAHYSKAQTSSKVPVDYTRRQYVKKPNKAKPGFVIYTNQKTLFVTPDAEAIERLLREELER